MPHSNCGVCLEAAKLIFFAAPRKALNLCNIYLVVEHSLSSSIKVMKSCTLFSSISFYFDHEKSIIIIWFYWPLVTKTLSIFFSKLNGLIKKSAITCNFSKTYCWSLLEFSFFDIKTFFSVSLFIKDFNSLKRMVS